MKIKTTCDECEGTGKLPILAFTCPDCEGSGHQEYWLGAVTEISRELKKKTDEELESLVRQLGEVNTRHHRLVEIIAEKKRALKRLEEDLQANRENLRFLQGEELGVMRTYNNFKKTLKEV